MSASDLPVSIIIPTGNEVENIAPLVSEILAAAKPLHEIIFIDDHSTDGTPAFERFGD
jgi:glycosyltransferase involved in cell wall biosynthesis